MEIHQFVASNITRINQSINLFKDKNTNLFIDVEIKKYLQDKLNRELENKGFEDELILSLASFGYVKAKIVDIANKFIFYKSDLEKFYKAKIFKNIFLKTDIEILTNSSVDLISQNVDLNNLELKFIKKDLKVLLKKSLFVVSQGGFTGDLQHTDYGLRVANEGDSAQFFFIARAMLAGFNCSNVDVRSSRYDAIVDFNSKLLRIQVKGVTSSGTISFYDRDRGGQGIDHTHERNKGKRITSNDCDIYVAVDKQVGICYLIPMSFADALDDETAKSVRFEKVKVYLEKWETIIEVARTK